MFRPFVHVSAGHLLALVYQTSGHQKKGACAISRHRSVFINLDVSIGYEQISWHVSRLKLLSTFVVVGEERGEIFDRSSTAADQKDRQREVQGFTGREFFRYGI